MRLKRIFSGHDSHSVRTETRVLKEQYKRRFPDGDNKLSRVAGLIDWNAFRSVLEPLFKNNGEGRHHIDVILMMKGFSSFNHGMVSLTSC